MKMSRILIIIFSVFIARLVQQGNVLPAKTASIVSPTVSFIEQYGCEIAKDLDLRKGIRDNDDKVVQMLANEARYKDTYSVVYHACNQDFYVVQEVLRHLYAYVNGTPAPGDFIFLRLWDPSFYKINSYVQCKNVQDFIRRIKNTMDDHQESQKEALLSVNPFIFGNFDNPGESTFHYFLDNRSNVDSFESVQLLSSYCAHYKISTEYKQNGKRESYIQDLVDLMEKYQTASGGIIQIFIPKESVNNCMYLSEPRGKIWAGPVSRHDGSIVQLGDFNVKKNQYSQFGGVLKDIQDNSASIAGVKSMQCRLFFGKNSILTNPDSGVKMFRFSQLNVEQQQSYDHQIRGICQKMFDADSVKKKKEKRILSPPAILQDDACDNYVKDAISVMENVLKAQNIYHALCDGDSKLVKRYIQLGEIDYRDRYGNTPLMYACCEGREDLAQFLIDHGADIDAQNDEGVIASMIAFDRGDSNSIELLFDNGARVDGKCRLAL